MGRKSVLAAAAVAALAMVALPSAALASAPAALVGANPVDNTPHVLDGEVEAIARIGHTVVVGGDFTQVQNQGQTKVLSRNNLFSYDEVTGKVSATFVPAIGPVGNAITSIIPTGDGTSVYLAGSFTTVNGVKTGRVARLDVTTGHLVPGFAAARPNATVNDMALSNGRLIVAGDFSSLAPPGKAEVARGAIASLNPATGALTGAVTDSFTGVGTKGTTSVRRIDVTPSGNELVAIGNFNSVDGQPRSLIAQLDLSGATSSLAPWQTSQFPAFDSGGATWCSKALPSYLRDVAYSTDGSYFIVVTSGAYHAGRLCDTQTRWETAGGAGQLPSWVQYTGGDTSTDVVPAANGRVFYVGGHFRWLNNPFASDHAGPGAVSRIGLAAIDPRNGMPYSWNPTRERGYGVYSFLPTSDGLFVGSDTNHLAHEFHPRLGFFPAAGGALLPPEHVSSLPADVYLLGRTSRTATNDVRDLTFDGSASGPVRTAAGSESWGSVRGAFAIDHKVYTGWSDGTLRVRSFDGTSFGPATTVAMTSPDPNSPSGFTPTNTFVTDLPTITGMFYDKALARIYYTQAGSTDLYYRYFEPQTNLVGAQKFTATGNIAALDPSHVNGMFLADGTIYFSDATGALKSIGYANGQITAGPATTVNTATDWRTRGMFAWDGGVNPNQPPVAFAQAACTGLSCAFTSTGSDDPDGTTLGYAWDFGDGSTATGPSPSHTYAADGRYTATLTVTDAASATATATVQVDVAAPTVGFRAAASYLGGSLTKHTITVPASVQPGDTLVMFVTNNSASAINASPAGWTSLGSALSSDLRTSVFSKVATLADVASPVSVTYPSATKATIELSAYSDVGATGPTAVSSTSTVAATDHTTPAVTTPSSGDWVLSYWADKSGSPGTTTWTAPPGQVVRGESIGTGSGHVASLLTDGNTSVAAGAHAGLTATADSASAKATTWTVVLPAP